MKMITRNNVNGKLKQCQGSLALGHNQVHHQMGLWRALLKGKGTCETPSSLLTCQRGRLGWGICPLKTLLSDYVEGNVVRYNFKFKHMLAVPKPSTQRQLNYLRAHG